MTKCNNSLKYIFCYSFRYFCRINIYPVMNLKERIETFSELGKILRDSLTDKESKHYSSILDLINTQHLKNQWFTPENVWMALNSLAEELTFENLAKWTDSYPALESFRNPIKVGVIMAGNIPLVGFHDFLSVLITGNNLIAKTSSKDSDLIVFIGEILCKINPGFKDKIKFTGSTLSDFEAVIATGSDNSSRYFEYYFGKYPNIIRRNRNSIAIIEGNETNEELRNLGTDIFSYFGLGCRNVSKLFVPEGYNFSGMIANWASFSKVINHDKYANNYDFSKAVYLVNKEIFTDTGYLLLKENKGLSSPVAVLYYEYYKISGDVLQIKENSGEKIQCIVGRNYIPFGLAQFPHLWDYADEKDTIEFLLKKNIAGIL